jgi:hypothetical protein
VCYCPPPPSIQVFSCPLIIENEIEQLKAKKAFVEVLLGSEPEKREQMCKERPGMEWLKAYKTDDELKEEKKSLSQEIHDLRASSGEHNNGHFSLFDLY